MTIHHPKFPEKSTDVSELKFEHLLRPVFAEGKILTEDKTPSEIYARLRERVALLPVEHQRFVSPHIYKVGISRKLLDLRNTLISATMHNRK